MHPVIVIGLLLSSAPMWAEADFGLRTKHSAKVNISRPPDAMLRGKSIVIRSRPGVAFPAGQALELAIERAMTGEFTPVKAGGDAVVTVAVSGYEPVTARTVTVTENRNVVVGKKPGRNLLGQQTQVDVYGMRAVPVQYWEGRGSLGLQVTVHDSAGVLVDSFNPQSKYEKRVETAENGVAKKTDALPSQPMLQSELIENVARQIQARYTKTIEVAEVRLTVDEPLRPGNAMAMSGQWKEALAAWTSVQMKKNPGDRAYNMAVAHEALGYQAYDASRNPDDAEESFKEALRLYEEALRSDPGEKFFRQAMERCAKMKDNFARAKGQYEAQQRMAEIEIAKAEAREKQAGEKQVDQAQLERELKSNRPDTQDEADFRAIARGRLKSVNGDISDEYQSKLVQFGRDAFKLEDLRARRVVAQEVGRRQKMGANLELYKQTFADLVGDKTLDAADRTALSKLAARLQLSAEDVKRIEAEFEYRDLTAPRAPAAPEIVNPRPVQAQKPVAPKPQTTVVPAQPKKTAVTPPAATQPATTTTPGIKK